MTRERNMVVHPTILRLGSSGRKACSSSYTTLETTESPFSPRS